MGTLDAAASPSIKSCLVTLSSLDPGRLPNSSLASEHAAALNKTKIQTPRKSTAGMELS
jgi:hypothetical protein